MSELAIIGSHCRRRLPNRREQITETVAVSRGAGAVDLIAVSVGFDPRTGEPAELFLAGAREGSDTAFERADIATALSVALQSGVTATAMARSAASIPDGMGGTRRASVTGAALDLVAQYESPSTERRVDPGEPSNTDGAQP